MNYRIQEFKVGILVIGSFIILVFFLFIISGIKFGKKTVTYTTHLDYVGDMQDGTPVRFGGVLVGRISNVRIPFKNEMGVKLTVDINADVPVKTDSKAYMTSIGLLGDYYLEIEPGSLQAELLPPGSEIPSLQAATFPQMSQTLSQLTESLDTTITRINQMLGAQNQQNYADILYNLNQVLKQNSEYLPQLFKNLTELTHEFDLISGRLDTMLVSNELVIKNLMQHLDSTLVESYDLVMQIQKTIGDLSMSFKGNKETYQSIFQSLEQSAHNLEDFTRIIRERPWLIVRKSDIKERKLPNNK